MVTVTETMFGQCHACGALVRLVKGFVLRRHLNATLTSGSRAERICPGSRSRDWSTLDGETSRRALAHWAELDG